MVEKKPSLPISIEDMSSGVAGPQAPIDFQSAQMRLGDVGELTFPSQPVSKHDVFLQGIESEEERTFAAKVIWGFDGLFKHPSYAQGTSPRKKLESYVTKIHQVMNLTKDLEGQIGEEKNHEFDVTVSAGSISDEDVIAAIGLRVGTALYGQFLTDEQVTLAHKQGVGDVAEEFADPLRNYTFKIINLPQQGIRLLDFIDPERIKNEGKIVDAYNLFTDTSHSDVADGDQDTFRAGTFQQSYALLYAFAPDDIFRKYSGGNSVTRESVKYAMSFAQGVREVRGEISNALFDMSHPMHEDISSVIQKDLQNPKRREIVLLLLVDSVKAFYRKSQTLSDQGEGELGQALMAATVDMLDGMKESTQLHKAEELESVFYDGGQTPEVRGLDDLKKKAFDIFGKSGRLEYTFEGLEIPFPGIVPPKNVLVFFEKGKPFQLGIEMQYENDHGEELTIDLYTDTKAHSFDWSFLEDPQKYPEKSQALLNYMYAVLERAEHEAMEIQRSKHRPFEVVKPSPARSKVRKVGPQGKRKPFAGSPQRMEQAVSLLENLTRRPEKKPEIKRNIMLPEVGELEKMLRKMSHDDRGIVLARIGAFNERGVGRIQLLRDLGNARKSHEGKLLGKVVMSGKNGGAKGIRVLVEQGECVDGNEIWTVRAVDYKESIYNGHALDKL